MVLFVAFPFLAFGCASFLLCAAIPPLRRFALSSSLWCVACVPCLLTILAAIIVCSAGAGSLSSLLQVRFRRFCELSSNILAGLGHRNHFVRPHRGWSDIHNHRSRNYHSSLHTGSFPPVCRRCQFRSWHTHLFFRSFRLRHSPAFVYRFWAGGVRKSLSRLSPCVRLLH
jgi:hypothetical protein